MKNAPHIKLLFVLSILFFLFAAGAHAQGWEKNYDSPYNDRGNSILQTQDGGFILLGSSAYTNEQQQDILIIKTDMDGDTIWTKRHHFCDINQANAIIAVDGGFVITGQVKCSDQNSSDLLLFKVDPQGQLLWQTSYNLLHDDVGNKIIVCEDATLAIVGEQNYSSQEESDFFLMKTTATGDSLWVQNYGSILSDAGNDVIQIPGGGFLLVGTVYENKFSTLKMLSVIKTDADGDTLWTSNIIDTVSLASLNGMVVIASNSNTFVIAGSSTGWVSSSENVFLIKIDGQGNEIWSKTFETSTNDKAFSLFQTEDGGFVLGGCSDCDAENSAALVLKTNAAGNEIWSKKYGGHRAEEIRQIIPTSNNTYTAIGYTESYAPTSNFYLLHTDENGNTYDRVFEGHIYNDANQNCAVESGESALQNWIVKASSASDTLYALSDQNGYFSISIGNEDYTLSAVIPPDTYWQPCNTAYNIDATQAGGSISYDFLMQTEYVCPKLSVDISALSLRRCFPNTYTVHYCNDGTAIAQNPEIEVSFDVHTVVDSSSIQPSAVIENRFYFPLDDVSVGACGNFKIYTTLPCDTSITFGQTHCTEARIYSNTTCPSENSAWDGASIEVDVIHQLDSLVFIISNKGLDMTIPLSAIIIEDDVLYAQSIIEDDVLYLIQTFMLNANDSLVITIPNTGKTYRLEAEQSPYHPSLGNPYAIVEGYMSDSGGNISTGFVTSHTSVDCQKNRGSYDPNDIRVSPKGYCPQHYIAPHTELEYMIRFQNTGTDTAFHVIIRDTLPEELDIETIRLGASSHAANFKIVNDRVAKFIFSHIYLPDSTTNEQASHGFVKFYIKPAQDISPGATINNKAAIYFDYNAPIITNEVYNTIEEKWAVAGSVFTETGQLIPQVDIGLSRPVLSKFHSKDGTFSFESLPACADYNIQAFKNHHPLEGLSTLDIIDIQNHLLGIQRLDSPYKIIAADINRSGKISLEDIQELRRLILHGQGSFSRNTSWRFVDASYTFPIPENPFAEPFPETISFADLDQHQEAHFVGIKTGDVSDDRTTPFAQRTAFAEEKDTLTLVANVEHRNRQLLLHFTAKNFKNIAGFQFALQFDSTEMYFQKLRREPILNHLTDENLGLTFITKGILLISWNGVIPASFSDDTLLFTLQFNLGHNAPHRPQLQLSNNYLSAEAYRKMNPNYDILALHLETSDSPMLVDYSLPNLKVYPNPTIEEITISYRLNNNEIVDLFLLDSFGQLRQKIAYHKQQQLGHHEHQLNVRNLPYGKYFIMFKTDKQAPEILPFVKLE